MKRSAVTGVVLLAALAASGPLLAAASGVVVDARFFPLPGARACLVEGERTGDCILTDGGGEYVLPDSDMTRVRITLDGYVPALVPAVDHVQPVMLQRSAALLVVVADATSGEPIPGGRFWITGSAGARSGPFPVSPGGTRVKSLVPGRYAVRAEIPGYLQDQPVWVELFPGDESRLNLRVAAVTSAR